MNRHFTKLTLGLAAIFFSLALSAEIPANAVWIDVRTPAEYERGHLPQATLIPLRQHRKRHRRVEPA